VPFLFIEPGVMDVLRSKLARQIFRRNDSCEYGRDRCNRRCFDMGYVGPAENSEPFADYSRRGNQVHAVHSAPLDYFRPADCFTRCIAALLRASGVRQTYPVCLRLRKVELVALILSHHRFLGHYFTPACSRISSISFDASALLKLSLHTSGVPACSHRVFQI
jgi:hypothetical protein